MDDKARVSALIAALAKEFEPEICVTDPVELAFRCEDFFKLHHGAAAALLKPHNVADVARMVSLCAAHDVAIIPQGGNTGVMGGAIPDSSGMQVLLSLERLNRIRNLDAENFSMTVEAGCVLAAVQAAANDADRLFPLSFGAEGSCQIGGALATNAGGSNVLRYGNARDLVLGLEVVLADGTIWNGLRRLRKDNTGYDLKHLFIGSEGTLGIITAAVLKLFPRPAATATVFVALTGLAAAPALLALMRKKTADAISAFELVPQRMIDLVTQQMPDIQAPFGDRHEWCALIEFNGADTAEMLGAVVESGLEEALEAELIADAVIASSLAQQQRLWALREGVAEAQIKNGAVMYFDVAVAVSSAPTFVEEATRRLLQVYPEVDINAFGHIGDGNIHFNLLQPRDSGVQDFLAMKPLLEETVYGLVQEMDGSISAEHGVGQAKFHALPEIKSSSELGLMQSIRHAIAGNRFNPGKVVESRTTPERVRA